jgi:hypothetical protein
VRSLLRNVPFRETGQIIQVRETNVEIKPFQILIWVTLCQKNELAFDNHSSVFPAVFDSGFNGTFCIREEQLRFWAGFDRRVFPALRAMRTNRGSAVVHKADLWLHGNTPGTFRPSGRDQFRLELNRGILVMPPLDPSVPNDLRPSLPLLGMHAFHRNDLRLVIDFKRQFVCLKKPRWFFTSFGI